MNPQFDRSNSVWEGKLVPVAQAPVQVRLDFIRKTYALFTAGILMAIIGGVISLTTPVGNVVISLAPWSFLSIFLFVIIASALSRKEGLNYVALFGFTFVTGVLFAPIVALYGAGVVGQAAFLTLIVFGSLTGYAFASRRDFSYLGGFLFVGLIALVLGGLANIFLFKSSGASYWMAWITVFLFSGFVLYDTSQIIHRYDERGYCAAALALFLDFFNLFMAILRILGGRD
jgi:FtsH-binding integral membrane protein